MNRTRVCKVAIALTSVISLLACSSAESPISSEADVCQSAWAADKRNETTGSIREADWLEDCLNNLEATDAPAGSESGIEPFTENRDCADAVEGKPVFTESCIDLENPQSLVIGMNIGWGCLVHGRERVFRVMSFVDGHRLWGLDGDTWWHAADDEGVDMAYDKECIK